jgi:uncharacterized protein YceK
MKYIKPLLIFMIVCLVLTGCSQTRPKDISTQSAYTVAPADTISESTPDETPVTSAPPIVPEYEVELVAKTLRGECYDDQPDDKREVVKVICNRVSVGEFGDSIEAVITAPRQFQGYRTDNKPTANDYEIAREVLTEWYENGCLPLGKYLYFSSDAGGPGGSNHKNIFRENFKEDFEP